MKTPLPVWPALALALLVWWVAGCTSTAGVTRLPDDIWQDAAFDHTPGLVSVDKSSLFALDPALVASMREQGLLDTHTDRRLAFLMTSLFGPEMKNFGYRGGHSTPAAQTWRDKSGDCLSLTVLTKALADALELPVRMQEVQVPVSFDRRGGIDFLNQHVNVLLRIDRPLRVAGRTLPSGNVVIDFEPQVGSNQRGVLLDDQAILARYLNNLAAEHFAHGRDRLAYAHFKAAIQADPGYASAYGNLAQLYLRTGLDAPAEKLLRHAVTINPRAYLALQSLQALLLAQGRHTEASQYQAVLKARRDQDPYYWIGLGLEQLRDGNDADAVDALERAQALTSGFDEVHRALAVAYWRVGKLHKARDQLAVLNSLREGDPGVAALGKKFKYRPEQMQLQVH
jgi:Tfp pilus assembly protein PilF